MGNIGSIRADASESFQNTELQCLQFNLGVITNGQLCVMAWYDDDKEEYNAELYALPGTSKDGVVFFDADGGKGRKLKGKKGKKSKYQNLFEKTYLECLDTECDYDDIEPFMVAEASVKAEDLPHVEIDKSDIGAFIYANDGGCELVQLVHADKVAFYFDTNYEVTVGIMGEVNTGTDGEPLN